jgi:hypothetical protein
MFPGALRPPHLVSRRLPANLSANHNEARIRSITPRNMIADELFAYYSLRNATDPG